MSKLNLKFLASITKREKFIFILTVSLAIGIPTYFFVLEPIYKKWSQLDTELESVSIKLLKDIKLLANKEPLEKDHATYEEYMQKADDKGGISSILKEIESTALSSGVKITSIKPKGEKQFKNHKKYRVELISEAKISQFLKFIYSLESSKKLFKVERVVLSLQRDQTDLLKGTLVIRKISF